MKSSTLFGALSAVLLVGLSSASAHASGVEFHLLAADLKGNDPFIVLETTKASLNPDIFNITSGEKGECIDVPVTIRKSAKSVHVEGLPKPIECGAGVTYNFASALKTKSSDSADANKGVIIKFVDALSLFVNSALKCGSGGNIYSTVDDSSNGDSDPLFTALSNLNAAPLKIFDSQKNEANAVSAKGGALLGALGVQEVGCQKSSSGYACSVKIPGTRKSECLNMGGQQAPKNSAPMSADQEKKAQETLNTISDPKF